MTGPDGYRGPDDGAFDAAMAMVTIHQWGDRDRGLRELRRVARGPVVILTFDGDELDLSPRQVELLALFLVGPRTVWSREQLHWVCWGDTSPSRRVDVQLCRLRAKTGRDLFRNVRDRGWALRPVA